MSGGGTDLEGSWAWRVERLHGTLIYQHQWLYSSALGSVPSLEMGMCFCTSETMGHYSPLAVDFTTVGKRDMKRSAWGSEGSLDSSNRAWREPAPSKRKYCPLVWTCDRGASCRGWCLHDLSANVEDLFVSRFTLHLLCFCFVFSYECSIALEEARVKKTKPST